MDLQNDELLKDACAALEADNKRDGWIGNMAQLFQQVADADLEERRSFDFHQKIWELNPVSDIGMGTVNITSAIKSQDFRTWVAEMSLKPLPEEAEGQRAFLQQFCDELVQRIKEYSKRVPWVKIHRVLAAFYPAHFTTVTDRSKALEVHRALYGKRPKHHPVLRQIEIVNRLNHVLGEPEQDPLSLARRMSFPWRLYEKYLMLSGGSDDPYPGPDGEEKLCPLPAMQRRKGLTSIKGGLTTIISALSFVRSGVSRAELLDHLRSEFPDYRDSSLRTLINVLKNEFHAIEEKDGEITPTPRGELLLETGDPQELIPPLITRILGVDHLLLRLLQSPCTVGDLVAMLQRVNTGWTSEYAPRAMIKWLRNFGLVALDKDGTHRLTDVGQHWAYLITWKPEILPVDETDNEQLPLPPQPAIDIAGLDYAKLLVAVQGDLAFPATLVDQLHLGLWSRSRRHFAILAGLSGSGKTLLAKRYAHALVEQFAKSTANNLFIEAVQPGWFDPSPLFGYINPIDKDHYIRPPFLDFLMQAVAHPEQPFVVILDEMNLSHPEQYFAPVLSAMETGDYLRLHNESENFDGVPNLVPYPDNLAIIGTVNMDETTHGISDKVLDRAFTLEFWEINLDAYPGWEQWNLEVQELATVKAALGRLLSALSPERLHFGWRTVEDTLAHIALARSLPGYDLVASLDDVVYARVLPKLRASESVGVHQVLDQSIEVLDQHGLRRSKTKLLRMKQDLTDTGIMRFWR